MINIDYFIDSIDYFYERYPVLKHILKYPENMANLIYEKNKDNSYTYYININVINSVKVYYGNEYTDKQILKRILKYNDVFDGSKFNIIIYTTNKNYKSFTYKNFINSHEYEIFSDVLSGVKIFKLDDKIVGKININSGNDLENIWIDYKLNKSNLLDTMLRGYEYKSSGSEDCDLIYQIINQINKSKIIRERLS